MKETKPKIKDNNQDNLTLLAISLTVIVTVSMGSGFLSTWDSMVGIVLAVCLMRFRTQVLDTRMILPLSLIWGFCVLIILGVVIDSFYVVYEDNIEKFTNNLFGPKCDVLFLADQPLWPRHIIAGIVWVIGSLVAYPFVSRLASKKNGNS